MERHIEKKHHSNLKSLFFPFRHMKNEVSKFGSLNPNYNRSTSDIYNSSEIWSALPYLQDKSAYEQNEDPFDAWLKMLRKTVEFRKLREELSSSRTYQSFSAPIHQSFSNPSDGFTYQPKLGQSSQQPFRTEDFEVIGYEGYICKECLIAHPLAIYRHKRLTGMEPIQTKHKCDNERILEIQQLKQSKETIIANLCMNELPELMLDAVREWTKGQTFLTAVEVSSPFYGYHEFIVSSEKKWAIRAITNGFTVVSDGELADFIGTVRDCTCACFKVADNEKVEDSGKMYFMGINTRMRNALVD